MYTHVDNKDIGKAKSPLVKKGNQVFNIQGEKTSKGRMEDTSKSTKLRLNNEIQKCEVGVYPEDEKEIFSMLYPKVDKNGG